MLACRSGEVLTDAYPKFDELLARQVGIEFAASQQYIAIAVWFDRQACHSWPSLRHAFGEVMTGFAEQLGAFIIAEGIENSDDLAAVARFGVTAGQSYHLGRPSTGSEDWAGWNTTHAEEFQPLAEADGVGSS